MRKILVVGLLVGVIVGVAMTEGIPLVSQRSITARDVKETFVEAANWVGERLLHGAILLFALRLLVDFSRMVVKILMVLVYWIMWLLAVMVAINILGSVCRQLNEKYK